MRTKSTNGAQSPPYSFHLHHTFKTMATVLTGEAINIYRAKVLLAALRLECMGIKRRGPSAFSIIKAEYNLTGNRLSVLNQLESILK